MCPAVLALTAGLCPFASSSAVPSQPPTSCPAPFPAAPLPAGATPTPDVEARVLPRPRRARPGAIGLADMTFGAPSACGTFISHCNSTVAPFGTIKFTSSGCQISVVTLLTNARADFDRVWPEAMSAPYILLLIVGLTLVKSHVHYRRPWAATQNSRKGESPMNEIYD